MANDISTIFQSLLDRVRKRGYSDDEILRVASAQGDQLLDKFANVIADAARKPVESFAVHVNYDLSVEQAIDAADFQAVNASITSKNFPTKRTGERDLNILLVKFDGRMSSHDAVSALADERLRPAELHELLAFATAYPEEQRKYSIVGIGSVWKDRRGFGNVPCLYEASEGRYLDLHWWDDGWYSYSRFAAVRE